MSRVGHGCRNATRGGTRLFVSSTASFSVNTWMRLLMDNINGQLLADLNGHLFAPDPGQNNKADLVQFNFRVTQVRSTSGTALIKVQLYLQVAAAYLGHLIR